MGEERLPSPFTFLGGPYDILGAKAVALIGPLLGESDPDPSLRSGRLIARALTLAPRIPCEPQKRLTRATPPTIKVAPRARHSRAATMMNSARA